MKKLVLGALGLVLCMCVLFRVTTIGSSNIISGTKAEAASIQESIAKKIIRFHVIANSDSEEDQAVKLKVKEAVVTSMEPMLENADSVDEVREIIQLHMKDIQKTAQDTLLSEGSTAVANAELTQCYFPVKTYGEYTFPDGEYEALRITIGEGEGKNWWCVMYPRLCFVDSLYSVVPEESKKELKKQLTDEEYEEILHGEKEVKIKWKFLELLGF